MRVLLTIGFFLVSCAIFSRSEDLEGKSSDEKWKIAKENLNRELASGDHEFDWPDREIDANKIGCWRYCVKKRVADGNANNESIKRVNIIWNVVDEARVTLTEGSSIYSSSSLDSNRKIGWESSTISSEKSNGFYRDDSTCELYLELGCKSLDPPNSILNEFTDTFSDLNQKKIVSKNDAIGLSSNVFAVDEDMERLRILAFGNLSQIVLEIPIAHRESNEATREKPRPTFSFSRTSDALGLLVDVRDPPSGGWRLNFQGVEHSNYTFSVTAVSPTQIVQYLNLNDSLKTEESSINENLLNNERGESKGGKSGKLSRPQRLAYLERNDTNSSFAIKSDDEMKGRESLSESVDTLTGEQLDVKIPRENETIELRSANLESELMEIDRETISDEIGENARILDNPELNEFSKSFNGFRSRRSTVVDIDPNAELIVPPGRFENVVFTVTNNHPVGIRYVFDGASKPFPFIGVIPDTFWLQSGQMIQVAVRIEVPNSEYAEPNVVTLYAHGNEHYDIVEKSAYVYVQGARSTQTSDSEKPNIEYYFNDNCSGKLHRDQCFRSQWSVEITVNDSVSGLKRVTSSPIGIEPRTEFISGTKNKVSFYYSASCCQTTVEVTAYDVQGNFNMQTLDVTAWYNLNNGEIAAIIVGSLLILLIIIFIILIIIYCVRKRKSHDLSYSQRYGSRPPAASTERSNF